MHTILKCSLPLFFVVGCSSAAADSETPPGATYDFTAALHTTVTEVIEPTYSDLYARAADLRSAAETLAASPTDANLDATRTAWVNARKPWEQSEAFLFGPVESLGIDPSIDSWPVDRVQLDQVIDSQLELTADSISTNFGGGLRGFHTIEYLLWGADHVKTASAFAQRPRELAYLTAAAGALEHDTDAVRGAWDGDGGYGKAFESSGSSGGLFFLQADAVQQLLNGMLDICDEVANGKIADPFKAQDRTLEESQFSYNSIRDFSDNIRSVKFVYQGSRGDPGSDSLSSFVRKQNGALDARAASEIDAAIAAILAISADGEPFTNAITDPAKSAVIAGAQDAIHTVMTTLQGGILPLVVR